MNVRRQYDDYTKLYKYELEQEGKGYKVDVPQMPVGVGNQYYENWSK